MNPNFNQYRKLITNPFKFWLFLLSNLPAAFFAGLAIETFDETKAIVAVKQKWFNKNPFGSVYFAVLTMAAEMSTGVLCMANIYRRNPAISMLVIKTEASFYKKATAKILFTCSDGESVASAVEEAIVTGEGKSIVCKSTGRNESGEVVAEIYCTWSFKARKVNSDKL
ncbi:MAG: DUF4442 domain-containing protein [Panacibacter sp.]